MRKRGPIVVPGRAALIWPGLSLSHFLQDSIPAWSLQDRNRTQVFAKWIFDESVQCKSATLDTTVCADLGPSVTSPSGIQAIVPWLGGDYNPWDGCDTEQTGLLPDGEFANEAVQSSCHPLICPIDRTDTSPFYRNHPTTQKYRCMQRNGEVVTKMRNVPNKYRNNLCRQRPRVENTCTHAHGMLMGLQGKSVQSLYGDAVVRHRDDIVAKTGAGLFWHGGNPIYYTAKGTEDDVTSQVQVGETYALHCLQCECFIPNGYTGTRLGQVSYSEEATCMPTILIDTCFFSAQAVLRSHLDDLAGHHIILKVVKDTAYTSTGFSRYMHVDRVPLTSAGSLEAMKDRQDPSASGDPSVDVYTQTAESGGTATTWGTLDGWLRNLASTMRAEQITYKVDVLHPKTSQAVHSSKWSCPLRRLSFWTQVNKANVSVVRACDWKLTGLVYATQHRSRADSARWFPRLQDQHASLAAPIGT